MSSKKKLTARELKKNLIEIALTHHAMTNGEYFKLSKEAQISLNDDVLYDHLAINRMISELVSMGVLIKKEIGRRAFYKYNYYLGKKLSAREQTIYNAGLNRMKEKK